MTPPALDPAAQLVVRGAFVCLFVASGVHKLRDLSEFRAALAGHRLLPERSLGTVAAGLAALEVGLALALALSWPLAPFAGAGLLLSYAGAIAINLARGRGHIDCGCGGPGGRRPLHSALVTRNLALAALLLTCALPEGARPLVLLDGVTVAGGVACLTLLYAALDVAVANVARLRSLGATP